MFPGNSRAWSPSYRTGNRGAFSPPPSYRNSATALPPSATSAPPTIRLMVRSRLMLR